MSRIIKVTALLDGDHEIEMRVRDDINGVTFEIETWSDERTTTRLVVEPNDATAFAKAIMLSARRAKKRQRDIGV